mmetsp:Transcript_87367/g.247950  ORF Transcript_87367/g.247950 Transcript_87367/m.247950 type:complete len:136 (-) Transcript_87367:518-925(-)
MALEWQRYQLDFDKTYEPGSAVEARHYEAFQRSLEFVEVQRARGNLSYSVDLNAFSDMLEVELLERFTPFEEYWGSDEERALDLEDFPLMGASNRWAHPAAAPLPRIARSRSPPRNSAARRPWTGEHTRIRSAGL